MEGLKDTIVMQYLEKQQQLHNIIHHIMKRILKNTTIIVSHRMLY